MSFVDFSQSAVAKISNFSYIVEVSVEKTMWDVVIDHSLYHCRSWQYLYFPKRPVKFIRITGTHNTINRVFHLVSFEGMLTQNVPETLNGLVVPKMNVASVDKSAVVLEGVSRNKNSLLNGNVAAYDWDNGYTCHQLGEFKNLKLSTFFHSCQIFRQWKHSHPTWPAVCHQFDADLAVGL